MNNVIDRFERTNWVENSRICLPSFVCLRSFLQRVFVWEHMRSSGSAAEASFVSANFRSSWSLLNCKLFFSTRIVQNAVGLTKDVLNAVAWEADLFIASSLNLFHELLECLLYLLFFLCFCLNWGGILKRSSLLCWLRVCFVLRWAAHVLRWLHWIQFINMNIGI